MHNYFLSVRFPPLTIWKRRRGMRLLARSIPIRTNYRGRWCKSTIISRVWPRLTLRLLRHKYKTCVLPVSNYGWWGCRSRLVFHYATSHSSAARIPQLLPLDHLANLLTLCVDNGTGNPLDIWIVAPHERDTGHVNCRGMVWNHGINERPVKRVLLSKLIWHQHPRVGQIHRVHHRRRVRGPVQTLFEILQLLYLLLLRGDNAGSKLFDLSVLPFLKCKLSHLHCHHVMGHHHINEPLIGILTV